MSLTVRQVTVADADEWLRMQAALFPGVDNRGDIAAYFDNPRSDAVTIVAERPSGGLAGFVEVGTRSYAEGCESQPVAYIEAWYVDPDVRRRGVGAALVRAAEQWAKNQGFHEIGSDVAIDNRVSQLAHAALGYQEVDRIVCFRRVL
jgi:aminoglycoside 6'-N-acetyltransferase I